MFAYELQQVRQRELQHRADQWRLVRDAKAARTAERRARRGKARAAVRTDAEGARAGAAAGVSGRMRRALHPHSAA
jgi:hypothetical protein